MSIPRPESYGAKGDGRIVDRKTNRNDHYVRGTDDSDAIRRCIREHGECWLQGKTYVIGSPLVFGPDDSPTKNVKIYGESNRRSILAFKGGRVANVSSAQESMIKIQSGIETFEIDELTIYCNGSNRLDGKGRRKTIGAVESRAFTDLMADLIVWGQTRAQSECFTLGSWSDYPSDHKWARGTTIIERIDFSRGPAHDPVSKDIPEITYIIACRRNGVRISDNLFRDLPRLPEASPCRQQLISFHGSNGVTIEGNVFENVDAHCVYADNMHAKNIRITGNSVRNSIGVFVFLLNSFASGSYENMDISGNVVTMKRPKGSIGPSAIGVILSAHRDKNSDVFRDVHIHGNLFRVKDTVTAWDPAAILFQTPDLALGFRNVIVSENSKDAPIDLKTVPDGVKIQ